MAECEELSNKENNSGFNLAREKFPDLIDDKIVTVDFLEASKGVVHLVDSLGRVFAPLSLDMNGNITKLKKSFDINPEKFVYLEDLIMFEKTEGKGCAIDALLWLTRALHFMLSFFDSIAQDPEKMENVSGHMSTAYKKSLEPYHGWVSRKLFSFFKAMVPTRSALYAALADSPNESNDITTTNLQQYLVPLEVSVSHIQKFYKENDLNLDTKAP